MLLAFLSLSATAQAPGEIVISAVERQEIIKLIEKLNEANVKLDEANERLSEALKQCRRQFQS
jgi:UDP-N-acetylglucosamine enolpyruvyl transferase